MSSSPPVPSTRLTVLTLNVWFDAHAQDVRYAAQIDLFSRLQPDVISLQEVTETYLTALKAALTTVPSLTAYTLSEPSLRHSFYGTALLIKSSLAPVFSRHELSSEMERELLLARILIGSRVVTIGCVHLESLNSVQIRRLQMEQCYALLADKDAILCGDFNFCSHWNYKEMQMAGGIGEKEKEKEEEDEEEESAHGKKRFKLSMPLNLFTDATIQLQSPIPPPIQLQSPIPPPPPPAPLQSLENDGIAALLPHFIDAWPAHHHHTSSSSSSSSSQEGFTFDTYANPMIPCTFERMRYDRILFHLPQPVFSLSSVNLIGTEAIENNKEKSSSSIGSGGGGGAGTPERKLPPIFLSDHFGVRATFNINE